jgi:hypothetical protein
MYKQSIRFNRLAFYPRSKSSTPGPSRNVFGSEGDCDEKKLDGGNAWDNSGAMHRILSSLQLDVDLNEDLKSGTPDWP